MAGLCVLAVTHQKQDHQCAGVFRTPSLPDISCHP